MATERSFGLLKGWFRRLNFLEMDSLDDIPMVIIIACTLHNKCLMQDDEFDESYDNEEEANFQDIGGHAATARLKRDTIKDMFVLIQ